MMMVKVKILLFASLLLHLGFFVQNSQGQCQMSGISNWNLPIQMEIIDTDRGEFYRAQTTNILSITSAVHSGESTSHGPYFEAALTDGDFVLSLSESFNDYEEFETSQSMSIAVVFSCSGATASTLIFLISIVDTNNNSPQFVPEDGFAFTVVPPIVPGYELTGCHGEIVARDIDLTNYDINFSIESNDYFEIINDGPGDVMKTYNARLVSKTLIRSLTEPLTLQITAEVEYFLEIKMGQLGDTTYSIFQELLESVPVQLRNEDVDLTNDPRRTATSTITIMADETFEVPSELAFNAAYYITQYFKNNTFYNDNIISLIEGFHEEVVFSLSGDNSESFSIAQNGNNLIVSLAEPLPTSSIEQQQNIYLVIEAERQYTSGAVATLVIELEQDIQQNSETVLFSQPSYVGSVGEYAVNLNPITVQEGYREEVNFKLYNDFEGAFMMTMNEDTIHITLSNRLPSDLLEESFVILVIEAIYEDKVVGFTVVTLEVETGSTVLPSFSAPYYKGTYSEENGLLLEEIVSITEGFDDELTVNIYGELSQYFILIRNGSELNLSLVTLISPEVLVEIENIVLTVVAEKSQNISATAVVIISITRALQTNPRNVKFSEPSYIGTIGANGLSLEPIIIETGNDEDVLIRLKNDFEGLFGLEKNNDIISIELKNDLPNEIAEQLFVILVVEARYEEELIGFAVITLEIENDNETPIIFSSSYYQGTYSNDIGLILDEKISIIEGFVDNLTIHIDGDYSEYFDLDQNGSEFDLVLTIPLSMEILSNKNSLILKVVAEKRPNISATALVVVDIIQDSNAFCKALLFSKPSYVGYIIESNVVLENISLQENNFIDVELSIIGAYSNVFTLNISESQITLIVSNEEYDFESGSESFIVLVIEASSQGALSAQTVVTLGLNRTTDAECEIQHPTFNTPYYTGNYVENGSLYINGIIFITNGNDPTINITLGGTFSEYFGYNYEENNIIELQIMNEIPPEILHSTNMIILTITAEKSASVNSSATVVLTVVQDYEIPEILFETGSYIIKINNVTRGRIGIVSATTTSEEAVLYKLVLTNDHLLERISVTNTGELLLSAPAESGIYQFEVKATTVFTAISATVLVSMTVDDTSIEVDRFLQPLIILNRDEEEPHENLVSLNSQYSANCYYRLTNLWPTNKDWAYIDVNGSLSLRSVDREDETIANMFVSQIHMELALECENDMNTTVTNAYNNFEEMQDFTVYNRNGRNFGSLEYGSNKWILAEDIAYDPRKMIVNVIINDINDNSPIFIDKTSEPISIGYPSKNIINEISPRNVITVQATDADIGENADILYWCNDTYITVEPKTGIVHAALEIPDQHLLTIYATDRNGLGLTGSIDVLVRKLLINNIATVDVENASPEHEGEILASIQESTTYKLHVLRSFLAFTDSNASEIVKQGRTQSNNVLRLYLYGLLNSEPITVETLIQAIEGASIAWIFKANTLESILENVVYLPSANTRARSFIVSTIILSILLVLTVLAILISYLFRRLFIKSYKNFEESISEASSKVDIEEFPKLDEILQPRHLLVDNRHNLEDSLHNILEEPELLNDYNEIKEDAEFEEGKVAERAVQFAEETKDDFNTTDYLEATNYNRRKSVTFNENVEKIEIETNELEIIRL